MSGPAKATPGGQVLVSKTSFYYFLSDITPFPFYLQISYILIKSDKGAYKQGEAVISEKQITKR